MAKKANSQRTERFLDVVKYTMDIYKADNHDALYERLLIDGWTFSRSEFMRNVQAKKYVADSLINNFEGILLKKGVMLDTEWVKHGASKGHRSMIIADNAHQETKAEETCMMDVVDLDAPAESNLVAIDITEDEPSSTESVTPDRYVRSICVKTQMPRLVNNNYVSVFSSLNKKYMPVNGKNVCKLKTDYDIPEEDLQGHSDYLLEWYNSSLDMLRKQVFVFGMNHEEEYSLRDDIEFLCDFSNPTMQSATMLWDDDFAWSFMVYSDPRDKSVSLYYVVNHGGRPVDSGVRLYAIIDGELRTGVMYSEAKMKVDNKLMADWIAYSMEDHEASMIHLIASFYHDAIHAVTVRHGCGNGVDTITRKTVRAPFSNYSGSTINIIKGFYPIINYAKHITNGLVTKYHTPLVGYNETKDEDYKATFRRCASPLSEKSSNYSRVVSAYSQYGEVDFIGKVRSCLSFMYKNEVAENVWYVFFKDGTAYAMSNSRDALIGL